VRGGGGIKEKLYGSVAVARSHNLHGSYGGGVKYYNRGEVERWR